MTYIFKILLVLFTICNFNSLLAQGLLKEVPKAESEFKASEPQVLATIDWLQSNVAKSKEADWKNQAALLIEWISASPNVTISIHADIVFFINKNPELLPLFMGGWTKYAIQHNYSNDNVLGATAGLQNVIKAYETNAFKKDKKMQELIELNKQNKLEEWVKDKMAH